MDLLNIEQILVGKHDYFPIHSLGSEGRLERFEPDGAEGVFDMRAGFDQVLHFAVVATDLAEGEDQSDGVGTHFGSDRVAGPGILFEVSGNAVDVAIDLHKIPMLDVVADSTPKLATGDELAHSQRVACDVAVFGEWKSVEGCAVSVRTVEYKRDRAENLPHESEVGRYAPGAVDKGGPGCWCDGSSNIFGIDREVMREAIDGNDSGSEADDGSGHRVESIVADENITSRADAERPKGSDKGSGSIVERNGVGHAA